MTLLDLSRDFFSYLVSFREQAPSGVPPRLINVRADLESILALMDTQVRADAVLMSSYEWVRPVLIVFGDEILTQSGWLHSKKWQENCLEMRHYGEIQGGQRFFDLLEELDDAPEDVAAVLYLCLGLGFHGPLAPGDPKLEQIKEQLSLKLPGVSPKAPPPPEYSDFSPDFSPDFGPDFQTEEPSVEDIDQGFFHYDELGGDEGEISRSGSRPVWAGLAALLLALLLAVGLAYYFWPDLREIWDSTDTRLTSSSQERELASKPALKFDPPAKEQAKPPTKDKSETQASSKPDKRPDSAGKPEAQKQAAEKTADDSGVMIPTAPSDGGTVKIGPDTAASADSKPEEPAAQAGSAPVQPKKPAAASGAQKKQAGRADQPPEAKQKPKKDEMILVQAEGGRLGAVRTLPEPEPEVHPDPEAEVAPEPAAEPKQKINSEPATPALPEPVPGTASQAEPTPNKPAEPQKQPESQKPAEEKSSQPPKTAEPAGAPAVAAQAQAEPKAQDADAIIYFLQVGSFREADGGNRLVKRLQGHALPALMVSRPRRDGKGVWHVVLCGPYSSKAGALEAKTAVKTKTSYDAIVRNKPKSRWP